MLRTAGTDGSIPRPVEEEASMDRDTMGNKYGHKVK